MINLYGSNSAAGIRMGGEEDDFYFGNGALGIISTGAGDHHAFFECSR